MNRSTQDAVTLTGVGLLVVAVVGAIIWWNINYKCVSEHHEWRTDCTTHRDSKGRQTGETCRERRVEVCDDWEPR